MNPEFRRHLWLEMTPYRLMAMPVVLAGLFLLASLAAGPNVGRDMALAAAVIFTLITVPWGNRLVADSLTREIAANTWDQQRMSAIDPWTMTWGKLFGGPVFAWYGGAFCLVVFVASLAGVWAPIDIVVAVALMIVTALFSHATCFLFSLLAVQRRRAYGVARTGLYQFVAILMSLPILYVGLSDLAAPGTVEIGWFGLGMERSSFLLLSVACGFAWALIGAVTAMRAEFQRETGPWPWLGFCAFSMIYIGGIELVPEALALRLPWLPTGLFPAFCLAIVITYVTVFSEPKNLIKLRRLADGWSGQDIRRTLGMLPRSVYGLGLIALCALVIMVAGVWDAEAPGAEDQVKLRLLTGSIFLFVVRDTVIVYLFMTIAPRSGERRSFLFLVLVYSAVPALASALSLDGLLPLFWPLWDGDPTASLLPPLVQALVALGVLAWVGKASARTRGG